MNLPFSTELYSEIEKAWPSEGKHILASYDESSVVVYQAYKPSIAEWAVDHQTFSGCKDYSLTRMSWIKTNFLWMMFRCGWASKKDQERVLAIRIAKEGFEKILSRAKRLPDKYDVKDSQAPVLENDDVRLQWDPDHTPSGDKCNRRAIQLGIRGNALNLLLTEWILSITDITEFVIEQRNLMSQEGSFDKLIVPAEKVYQISNSQLYHHLLMDT